MATQIRCGGCGKVFTVEAADTGRRLMCSACGRILANPLPRPSPKAPAAAPPPPKPVSPANSDILSPRMGLWIAAAACVLCVILVGVIVFSSRHAPQSDGDRYWHEHYEELVQLKADAERLAISGDLAGAHAKYQELEKRLAGRQIKDSRLWDLTERIKQDQDRVFGLLMLEVENRIARERTALQEQLAAAQKPKEESSAPYPSSFHILQVSPATQATSTAPAHAQRPVTATSRPVAAATRPASRPALTGGLPIAPVVPKSDGITDPEIGRSIQRAVDFLLSNFEADQIKLADAPNDTYREGLNALCVYALLKAGQTIPDKRLDIHNPDMVHLIERMKDSLMLTDPASPKAPVTYARSLRVAALSVYNRPEDRDGMEKDVLWLLKSSNDGSYTYNDELNRFSREKERIQRFVAPGKRASTLYFLDPRRGDHRTLLDNGEKLVPVPPGMGYSTPGASILDPYRSRLKDQMNQQQPWDNSNTQYAHMAVALAAQCGANIAPAYWSAAGHHWEVWELQTGQWCYDGSAPVPLYAMTTGGIASLLAVHENLEVPQLGTQVGKGGYSPWVAAALAWMEKDDNAVDVTRGAKYVGYNLFNLARVGLGTGYKYFGKHDWYKELAGKIIATQYENGAFGRSQSGADALIDTAYVVLFLASGREPVMFNKLRYDGPWNNRTRDVANLARFASLELERAINWQVVPVDRDWTDWCDAPVLYIAGHEAPKLDEAGYAKLRQFTEAGGLIFAHADGNALEFDQWVRRTALKIFPAYKLLPIPRGHEIYSLQYKLADPPALYGVSNGSRLLMVYAGKDLSAAWQLKDGSKRQNFELGVNVFLYAAGKPNLRNRLASTLIPEITQKPLRSVQLARVKYDGTWDPEPYAFTRFSRFFQRETGWALEVQAVKVEELGGDAKPIAYLTGTAAISPGDARIASLAKYVNAGGLLVIDACGGSKEFSDALVPALAKAFPGKALAPLDAAHPSLHATFPGMVELPRPPLRAIVRQRLPNETGQVLSLSSGRGMVVYCPLDLTTGLLGTHTWGVMGYEPDFPQMLLKNLVIWRANQR